MTQCDDKSHAAAGASAARLRLCLGARVEQAGDQGFGRTRYQGAQIAGRIQAPTPPAGRFTDHQFLRGCHRTPRRLYLAGQHDRGTATTGGVLATGANLGVPAHPGRMVCIPSPGTKKLLSSHPDGATAVSPGHCPHIRQAGNRLGRRLAVGATSGGFSKHTGKCSARPVLAWIWSPGSGHHGPAGTAWG